MVVKTSLYFALCVYASVFNDKQERKRDLNESLMNHLQCTYVCYGQALKLLLRSITFSLPMKLTLDNFFISFAVKFFVFFVLD